MRRPKDVEYMRANLQKIKDFKLSDVTHTGTERDDAFRTRYSSSPYFNMRLEDVAILYKCAKENQHLKDILTTAYYRCSDIPASQDVAEWYEYKERHVLHKPDSLLKSEAALYLLWVLEGAPE